QEMEAIRQQLATTPLLTLISPAGYGKTRLAVEVAERVADDFPDGLWFVALDRITKPARVLHAVAAVLGVREGPERPLIGTLAGYLAPKYTLLVLDNCEHVIGGCAHLLEVLLKGGPRLRVLATSRQPLGIGEKIFKVPPLAMPDPRGPRPTEELAHYEA